MPIQTVCKFVERVVIKDFINNPDILKFISDKVKSNEVSDIKNMLIKIITDDNPVYLLFLGIRGTDKNKLYFLMLDSMYFDVDNFRMGTADLTTRPTKLDLIEIATSENLIATTEFDFTKWSLLSDDRTSGENSKIKPKKIQILVNRNEDVFLDLKMRRLDREFKIVNRIKKQKGNLL
jgi:hypothetical protein